MKRGEKRITFLLFVFIPIRSIMRTDRIYYPQKTSCTTTTLFRKSVQKIGACVLKNIQHILEPVTPFVIRIWHMVYIETSDIFRNAFYLLQRFGVGRQAADILVVRIVHRQYHIEILEIRRRYTARTVEQIVSSFRGGFAHPAVRQVARMTAVGSGRIQLQTIRHPPLLGHRTHYSLSRR